MCVCAFVYLSIDLLKTHRVCLVSLGSLCVCVSLFEFISCGFQIIYCILCVCVSTFQIAFCTWKCNTPMFLTNSYQIKPTPIHYTINRGSAIARIVGGNVKEQPGFDHEVKMWVFEEMVDGKKLTEIINDTHENVKYLPGFKIPENVVSVKFSCTCLHACVCTIKL